VWTELASATGGLALHHVTDESLGKVSLSFEAEEPLELVIERLRASGFEPEGTSSMSRSDDRSVSATRKG